jgi:N-acyl-D-aspartate/D-glutamate deacylase
MSDTYDLVIRGGTIADGTGGPLREADIVIKDAKIAAIGAISGRGITEIDAKNRLVTPGFIDVHTHYDAQVTWGSHLTPSTWNGVTTVLIGNCGVGFAPCLPERRHMLVELMEGVEDIPEVVLTEGLPWNWQSFPEYLDALDARRFDADVCAQVPHAALRVHVMGQRGWMQVISDFEDLDGEFALLRRLAAGSGRPMTISLLQREQRPQAWRRILDHIHAANAAGCHITGQVMGRPVGVMLGFEISQNPFIGRPSWAEVAALPFPEKLARLRDPAFRARLIGETTADPGLAHRLNTWEKIFPLGDRPDYEPAPEASVAARAAREGRDPQQVVYDMLLERDGHAVLYRPIINYADGDLAAVAEMMQDPATIMGLGDGGAHVSIICDASAPTTMITHWTRDRTRGPKLDLPWVIRRLSADNAAAIGLSDRGRIAPGLKADLNVIDYDRLCAHAPEVLYDLPAGGRRLVQRTEGYVATILSGVAVHREGQATGALPGRLVRGTR